MKGYNAKSKFRREGVGEESSFINRLNSRTYFFGMRIPQNTTFLKLFCYM